MKRFSQLFFEDSKVTKRHADYQDSPKDGEMCKNCTMWIDNNQCSLVRGSIMSNGWCKYFKKYK